MFLGALFALKGVEEFPCIVGIEILWRESNVRDFLRGEPLTEVFVHDNNVALYHGVYDGHNLLDTEGDTYVVDFEDGMFGEEVYYAQLLVGEVGEFARKVGRDGDGGFAGEFEGGGEGGRHNVAEVAHVVVSHPAPQAELLGRGERFGIGDGEDVFGFVGGNVVMKFDDEGGVELLLAKLDHDPLADGDDVGIVGRYAVGKRSAQVERKDYFSV